MQISSNIACECEFCGHRSTVMVLADHPALPGKHDVYTACPNCLPFLITHSLTPDQYLRAKRYGGDVHRFYLHDDFYDEDTGMALQPMLGERGAF